MFHEILTVLFSGETPYSEGGRNEETAWWMTGNSGNKKRTN
jgi:hypothetical protein